MSNVATYDKMKDSGIEWVGNVPSHWRIHTLYQLVTQVKEKNSDLQEKNLLSLSYGKIKRKDIDSPDGLLPASFDGYNIIEAGDIVLRLTDLQNDHTSLRVGVSTEHGIITSAYTTLRPINPSNSKYLYYLLHCFDLKKGFYGMGSGVRQGLNYAEVKELRIVLPNQKEQDSIVCFLDEKCAQVDTIIEETKANIAEYKSWKSSIIVEAVTKGLISPVEMKDSHIDWIGKIPRHWKLVQGKLVSTVNSGREINGDGAVGHIDVYGSGGPFKKTNQIMHSGEAVLFGRKGTLGKPQYVDCDFWAVDTIYYAYADSRYMKTKYLYYQLTALDWEPFITHTAIPSIVANDVFESSFVLPPIDEQKAIIEHLDKQVDFIDSLIIEKQNLITELELYKRSLIFETVTGKRKVV